MSWLKLSISRTALASIVSGILAFLFASLFLEFNASVRNGVFYSLEFTKEYLVASYFVNAMLISELICCIIVENWHIAFKKKKKYYLYGLYFYSAYFCSASMLDSSFCGCFSACYNFFLAHFVPRETLLSASV